MEPSSDLYGMSPGQNSTGWKPPTSLRVGQQQVYEVLQKAPQKQRYAIQLPTGYGKSWCACIAFAVCREQGRCTRALFVVPSIQQHDQYLQSLRTDLHDLGISCQGID